MLVNDNKQKQFYEIVKSRSDDTLLTVSATYGKSE